MPSVESYPSRTSSSADRLDKFPSSYLSGDETECSNIVAGTSWQEVTCGWFVSMADICLYVDIYLYCMELG